VDNLYCLATLDDTAFFRLFGHIFAPCLECFYFFIERVAIKIDVEHLCVANLRMINRADFLDGLTKSRMVRATETNDAFR
jgi:hypothetical protein